MKSGGRAPALEFDPAEIRGFSDEQRRETWIRFSRWLDSESTFQNAQSVVSDCENILPMNWRQGHRLWLITRRLDAPIETSDVRGFLKANAVAINRMPDFPENTELEIWPVVVRLYWYEPVISVDGPQSWRREFKTFQVAGGHMKTPFEINDKVIRTQRLNLESLFLHTQTSPGQRYKPIPQPEIEIVYLAKSWHVNQTKPQTGGTETGNAIGVAIGSETKSGIARANWKADKKFSIKQLGAYAALLRALHKRPAYVRDLRG